MYTVCGVCVCSMCLFLPGSSHGLGVADSQADHRGDVHPPDGRRAPLALVVAQEAALQGAPAASHVWNTYTWSLIHSMKGGGYFPVQKLPQSHLKWNAVEFHLWNKQSHVKRGTLWNTFWNLTQTSQYYFSLWSSCTLMWQLLQSDHCCKHRARAHWHLPNWILFVETWK